MKKSGLNQVRIRYHIILKNLTVTYGNKMGELKQSITPATAKKSRLIILDRGGFTGIKKFQLYANNLK
jgi:hypothetical protein